MVLLLGASAFFSGCETALFSLTAHQRLRITREESIIGQALRDLLAHTRGLLITLLMGNMTINVLYFVTSTLLLIRLSKYESIPGSVVAALSVGPLILVVLFGEVMPKLIASRSTVRWTRVCALPLLLIHKLLTPIRLITNMLVITPLARLIAPVERPAELSPQELAALLELSRDEGVIDLAEEELLQQVLSLGQIKVRDLMTPRVDLVGFDIAGDPARLVEVVRESRRSRIVVYRESLDSIDGIAYARQVLLQEPKSADEVKRLVRQVRYIPELQRADQLLVQFRKTGTTVAIVVDEYGGTAGLITLEDVVEHMVGDISSPGETTDDQLVKQIGDNLWEVGAALSIRDWADAFGHQRVLMQSKQVSTVGGLVMATIGRMPRIGDKVRVGNLELSVHEMADKRLQTLHLRLLTHEESIEPIAQEVKQSTKRSRKREGSK